MTEITLIKLFVQHKHIIYIKIFYILRLAVCNRIAFIDFYNRFMTKNNFQTTLNNIQNVDKIKISFKESRYVLNNLHQKTTEAR